MPRYIQSVVFDNSGRGSDIFYADDDEIVGLEVRKKSIAGNIWEALTGKPKKPEVIFLDNPTPRQDLVLYERRCRDDDLALVPFNFRPPSPVPWQHRWTEVECSRCMYCMYEPNLGRWHRPGPRLDDGSGRYDYYEHGHVWDRAPFWDMDWIPPRWRGVRPSSWRRGRHPYYSSAAYKMRKEKIKLMQQRLDEERHERIYGQYLAGYTFDKWRQRTDRIRDLDEKIARLDKMWTRFYAGDDESDSDSSDD